MSQRWKSPTVTRIREEEMPYLTPSQKYMSPKSCSSPHQNWKWPASQRDRSPQHYNPCPSPNGYWGSQRQWSPNQWEPVPNYHRSWSPNPKSPKNSPYYKQSPEYSSIYTARTTQAHFRRNHKDISRYYSPSMVEDPWAELIAETTESTGSTLEQFSENNTPLRRK